MINRFNQTEYLLFFGTNHLEGLKQMNAAMWKVDPAGAFKFSDRTNPKQKVLFQHQPNYDLLKKLIIEKFRSKKVPIEELKKFVLTSGFRETHYKKPILSPMEEASEIDVIAKPNRRKGTYPSGTLIRFFHS